MSCRPDLVALSQLQDANLAVNQALLIGDVPGIPIGRRFYGRCEVAAVGLHNHWLNGISYVADADAKKRGQTGCYAVSIIVSGGYEDDEDDGTELVYTGQGGNDLLGKKRQLADQKWERGNAALRGNAAQAIPVRVTRGNKDDEALYGKVFIYDGLYDVLDAAETVGVSGCVLGWAQMGEITQHNTRARSKPAAWLLLPRGGTIKAPEQSCRTPLITRRRYTSPGRVRWAPTIQPPPAALRSAHLIGTCVLTHCCALCAA